MKLSEAVLESMSYIDESILAESEAEKKTSFSWKPFLSFAAVCMLVMAVVFNPSKTADSAAPAEANQESTVEVTEEESAFDGLAPSEVLLDQKLTDLLSQLNDGDLVKVRIETVVSADSESLNYNQEQKNTQAAETDTAYAGNDGYVEMSKAEILSFEGEEGVTYIFHLYEADETE